MDKSDERVKADLRKKKRPMRFEDAPAVTVRQKAAKKATTKVARKTIDPPAATKRQRTQTAAIATRRGY